VSSLTRCTKFDRVLDSREAPKMVGILTWATFTHGTDDRTASLMRRSESCHLCLVDAKSLGKVKNPAVENRCMNTLYRMINLSAETGYRYIY